MKQFHFSSLIVLSLLLGACGGSSQKEQIPENKINREKPVVLNPGSVSQEVMQDIWDNCDNIDILFYEHPISVNQVDQKGIRGTVQYISTRPATLDPNCKAIGRISFMTQGEIKTEADIYLGNGCSYFAFLDGQEIVAANLVSPQGLQFFNQVLKTKPPVNE